MGFYRMSHPKNEIKTNERTQGIIYILTAYLIWGILPLFWKQLESFSAGIILAHRIIWSFVFVSILLTITKRWTLFKKTLFQLKSSFFLLISSIIISINWFVYIWAVNHNHIIETSLGYYINPLISILLGMLLLKEKLTIWQKSSLLLAFIGVMIQVVSFGEIPWIALILAVSFGLYGLAKKKTIVDSMVGLGIETLFIVPLALIFLYLRKEEVASVVELDIKLTSFLVLAGVVTAIPLLFFAMGTRRIPLSTVGFLQYVSPTITLMIGLFLYNETFTAYHFISFIFIWIALILYSLSFSLEKYQSKG